MSLIVDKLQENSIRLSKKLSHPRESLQKDLSDYENNDQVALGLVVNDELEVEEEEEQKEQLDLIQ
jgi:hypothetical protein